MSLSDKSRCFSEDEDCYMREDVKQFIKELKEFVNIEHDGSFMSISVVRERIDKLAGEGLI